MLTLPFIMNEMTDSGLWVGLVGVAHLLPSALVSPWAGSLADRYQRRTILLITQIASAMVATIMSVMWASGVRSPTAFLAIAVVGGTANGFGIPAWQAFVADLVPRSLLLQAVALNSTQFSVARAVGPMVAGVLLKVGGPSWTFAVDAMSFGAAVAALVAIRVPRQPPFERAGRRVYGELVDTFGYVRGHTGLSTAVISVAMLGMCGLSLVALLVLFTDDVYHVDESWLGWMAGLLGLGAVLASPLVARAKEVASRSSLLFGSFMLYSLALILFAASPWFTLALVVLPLVGAAHIVSGATLNTTVQLQVASVRRGKVVALYLMALLVAVPIGQFVLGSMSDVVGPRVAVVGAGVTMLAFTGWLRASGRLASVDEKGDDGA